tara:strand:- start:625 stop:1443 length:819 start_codon:yes stop_codon:yes gene_type:complete
LYDKKDIPVIRLISVLTLATYIGIGHESAPQTGGLGVVTNPSNTSSRQPHGNNSHPLDLESIKRNSRGIGSGEQVFLHGEGIGKLPEGFFSDGESNDYNSFLQKVLRSLAPLLGNLEGREFVIERVMRLPNHKLVRFYQIVEGAKLPQSQIVAHNNNEIQSVTFYSISPEKAKKNTELQLTRSELLRLFTHYALDYYASHGFAADIKEKNISGPNFRYLPADMKNGKNYRYVADFFYDGSVFVIDAISGELIRAGNFGAATRISAGQSAGLS